jgi:mannose-6-phosphate isomerase-like protein (cupin superfamily)
MSGQGWAVARLDDVEAHVLPGGARRSGIREHLDIQSFGINVYTGDEGQPVVAEHTETQALAGRHQELYFVLSGRATFTVDDEEVDAPTGTIVVVGDPGTRRAAFAREDRTTVLVVGAPAGEAYTVGRWEPMAGFFDFYARGDYEGGIAFLEDCLRRDPGYPGALYNLACSESLAGRGDAAVEHLREALEAEPGLRESARDDEDFAPLRDDPRFEELLR